MKILYNLVFAMIIAIAFASCRSANGKQYQHIERLSQAEIDSCDTPRAAAYNFVMSIIDENYSQTAKLMSLDLFYQYMQPLFFDMIPINELFSTKYMHKIVDMRPVVKMGYDVVVTDIQPYDSEKNFDEGSKYKGKLAFLISLDCANTDNKFYDDSKGEYDTAVTVTIVEEDGVWKVLGFE